MAMPEEAPVTSQQLQYQAASAQVERARAEVDKEILKDANALGISKTEYERRIRDKLKRDLKGPISIRRGTRGASSVLGEGRFKTQFETGTSGGMFDPEYRAKAERLGLGIPDDILPAQRPIYGYIRTGNDYVGQYGAIEFELKDYVRERTTVTVGDSLGGFAYEEQTGAPISDPDKQCWSFNMNTYMKHEGAIGVNYLEAQIQGGVTVTDIRKVRIHGYPGLAEYDAIAKMAEQAGLAVEYVGP